MRWVERCDTWPQVEELRKAKERFIREIGANVEISDLPTGERMQWVNEFFEGLVDMLHSERPAEQIHDWIINELEIIREEMVKYQDDIYRREEAKWGSS